MITCRVCHSLINVEGKMHQHVVKCGVCNEATVSSTYRKWALVSWIFLSDLLIVDPPSILNETQVSVPAVPPGATPHS